MTKYIIEKGHYDKHGRVCNESYEFTDIDEAYSFYNTTEVNRRNYEYVTLYSITDKEYIKIHANKGKGVKI